MRNNLVILIAFFLTGTFATAQYYHDFGANLGLTNYVGEIGGKEDGGRPWLLDMKLQQTKIDGGGFYRYRLSDNLGFQVGLNYMRIGGADSLSTNPGRAGRNLHFKNTIWELALRGEYYFMNINDVGGRGRYQLDFKAFIFAGFAGFHHNPKAQNNAGEWVALQPLKTEGVLYSKYQVAIPFGMGFFYTYKRVHRIGWEFNVRKTFTDYLDDAKGFYIEHPEGSTSAEMANQYNGNNTNLDAAQFGPESIRGNPEKLDWYLTTNVTYSYVLRGKSSFIRKKHPYTYGNKKHKKRTRAKF